MKPWAKRLLASANRALIALMVLLFPRRDGALYRAVARLYHGTTFVLRHRRLPRPPAAGRRF